MEGGGGQKREREDLPDRDGHVYGTEIKGVKWKTQTICGKERMKRCSVGGKCNGNG